MPDSEMDSGVIGTYVPWFCLVSAVATIVARTLTIGKSGGKIKWSLVPLLVGVALALLVLLIKGWAGPDIRSAFVWFAVGVPAGAIFSGLSQLGFSVLGKVVVSAGTVGFLMGGSQSYLPDAGASEALALAAGLGVGATLLALQKPGLATYDLPVIAVLAVLVGSLGAKGEGGMHEQAGTLIIGGAVVAGLVGMAVTKAAQGKSVFGLAAGVFLFGLSVWYWGPVFFGKPEVFYSGIAGVVAALVCCWAVSKDNEHRPLPYALGSLLWLGVATYAFSQQHGYGMSIAAFAGVLTMLMLDRRDVLVTTSPIVALVFFRLFTEMFPNSTRALDIGQHYGLLGLLVGIAVVIVVMESLERFSKVEGLKARGAGALTGVIALGVVLAAAVFLGQKGSVGLLVGLCLGPAVKSLGSRVTAGSVALSLALVAAFVIAHPSISTGVELDHEGKQNLVLWTGGLVTVLGLATAWLARPDKEEKNEAK